MGLTHESDTVPRIESQPPLRQRLLSDDHFNVQPAETSRKRTLFISDVHLGTKGCQAERLLETLRDNEADTIYLVGDIVDGWQLKSGWYWPQSHNDVLQKLLRQARKGARLIYVPGNHDEFLRDFLGVHFGGVELMAEAVHVATDGRRYLITHGDQFDLVVKHARWLAPFGDHAHALALATNTTTNFVRRRLGLGQWSLSQWAKLKVKNAVNYIGDFEEALAAQARRQHCDGVVCGHIHHPTVRDIAGIRYVNCGDWVESCTLAAESDDGTIEILAAERRSARAAATPARARAA